MYIMLVLLRTPLLCSISFFIVHESLLSPPCSTNAVFTTCELAGQRWV